MDRTVLRAAGAVIVAALAFAATLAGEGARLALGVLIGLPSFALMIISRGQLGKSFAVLPEARELVTTGLYSKIQHPMYVFLDLFLVALIVVFDVPVLLLAWGILVAVQLLQVRREEKMLADAFGVSYESYRSRTWF
jgi:protein-S-isoprenylcysteine O-methyltransferase Ste14